MTQETPKNRKWERYGCLLPCRIVCQHDAGLLIPARIINIGRGGVLIEADYDFVMGDKVMLSVVRKQDVERFAVEEEVHGTVRWGQVDASSLMGVYYIGIEFDDLLPLKQAATQS